MNFKKRRMSFIPEVNPKSFVLYFEKGETGRSWSIRDYSVENTVQIFGPENLHLTAHEIQERTLLSIDAPAVRTEDLAFWYDHTRKCNELHSGLVQKFQPTSPLATSKADSSTISVLISDAIGVYESDGTARQMDPRAFVSHSTQDHLFVEKFAADLRTNGVDAWFSKWEIKPGDSIRAKIEEGLEGCEYFIIVLSKNSITRPWVQTELDAATIRKLNGKVRKIIPVRIEDCGDLPPTLGALLWEDFSNQPYESALKRILASIFEIDVRPPLGKRPAPTPLVEVPPKGLRPEQTQKRHPTNFPIHIGSLGRFAEQLRKEGFDARTDLFNGQVGLIVGPKGLDERRMPPEAAGLFFPLWELNHQANRPLVRTRNFHDIFENRPKDWTFNRPYQHNATTSQASIDRGHWSRSATTLGDVMLEETVQRELTCRFPPDKNPVNINVVGKLLETYLVYAMVRISNFDAGIEVYEKAFPATFLDSDSPTLAAVIETVERVLLQLRESGQLN